MTDIDVVYPRIDNALQIVTDELDVIEAERQAFESFLARFHRLEPTGSVMAGTGRSLTVSASFQGYDPEAVRDAYRATVLAMDHYERDYDEPLIENVMIEFGESVGALFTSDRPIPPMNAGVIETAVEQSVSEREDFIDVLVDERDSLEGIRDRLGHIETELHGIRKAMNLTDRLSIEHLDRLESLRQDCQSLSTDRQQTLHHRPARNISGIGDRSLTEYLYDLSEYRFPALVEIADVAQRVEAIRQTVDRAAHLVVYQ